MLVTSSFSIFSQCFQHFWWKKKIINLDTYPLSFVNPLSLSLSNILFYGKEFTLQKTNLISLALREEGSKFFNLFSNISTSYHTNSYYL